MAPKSTQNQALWPSNFWCNNEKYKITQQKATEKLQTLNLQEIFKI
jgi:transcription initiation factor IIE alpha subunit